MGSRPALGEIALATAFAAVGVFWMATAASMPLWDGFAPGSGFLPLVYGGLLTVLAGGVVAAGMLVGKRNEGGAREPVRKPAMVAGLLACGAASVELLGFVAAIFAMLFLLYAVVERRPLMLSLIVSGLTATILSVVFRSWLGVPLPLGPWGF
jgi:hypothetical protein